MKYLVFLYLIIFSLSSYADKFKCESSRGYSGHPVSTSLSHNHLKYMPKTEMTHSKSFAAYHSVFDTNDDDNNDGLQDLLANPVVVSYHLIGVEPDDSNNYSEPKVSIDRPKDWYKAPGLSFLWEDRDGVSKKRLDDSYDGIGRVWNRGHWAMSDHAQRISAEASCNTHFFWNASPQAKDLNQGPWRHLENYSAAASNRFGEVWVITGPIFDDIPILYIGDDNEVPVAVPHALFKVIVRETVSGIDLLAFIFEQPSKTATEGDYIGKPVANDTWVHCNKAGKHGHQYNHSKNLVALEDIERRTGISFFPMLSASEKDNLAKEKASKLWEIESKYWDKSSYCGEWPPLKNY